MQSVRVVFSYLTQDIAQRDYEDLTNASGIAGGSISVPDCNGNYTVTHTAPNGQTWRTELDVGGWWIDVPDAYHPGNVGVGGDNYPYVVIGHLCDQTYLP